MPFPKEYLFPQTRFCVPFSAMYKKSLEDEFQVPVVKSLTQKLQRIVGKAGFNFRGIFLIFYLYNMFKVLQWHVSPLSP